MRPRAARAAPRRGRSRGRHLCRSCVGEATPLCRRRYPPHLRATGAIALTRVGASELALVGAMELSRVGAIALARVGAIGASPVGAIALRASVQRSYRGSVLWPS